MPYRNMTLDDFARYVGMDAREVARLAQRGKLPAERIGGEYRFNRAQVTDWLRRQMHLLDEPRLAALDEALGRHGDVADEHLIVTEAMGLAGIDMDLRAGTKAAVLRRLVDLADRTGLLWDPDGLLDALQQREALCPTALPGGVAMPHPRRPLPHATAESLICLARVADGVGFGAEGGRLTYLFFLIVSHEDSEHLHQLAHLTRMLDEPTVGELLDTDDPTAALDLLIRRERTLFGDD